MPTLKYRNRDELVAHAAAELEQSVVRDRQVIQSYVDVEPLLRLKLGGLDREAFGAVYLDQAHRVLAYEELARGTVKACNVAVREIARAALRHNASAVILAHNHPSGNVQPSETDVALTNFISRVLDTIEVRVLDHIVVSESSCQSFEQLDLMKISDPEPDAGTREAKRRPGTKERKETRAPAGDGLVTLLRAVQTASWRLGTVVAKMPIAEDDNDLAEILQTAGKQSLSVMWNALDELERHGVHLAKRAGESERVFEEAYDRYGGERWKAGHVV